MNMIQTHGIADLREALQWKKQPADGAPYAVNSMDPCEAIVWFTSRGDECLSCPSRSAQSLVRDGALIFRIHKR